MTSNQQKKNTPKRSVLEQPANSTFLSSIVRAWILSEAPSVPFCFLNIWRSLKSGEDPLRNPNLQHKQSIGYFLYLNPRRVWNLGAFTTKNRPGGWNLTPLEGLGGYQASLRTHKYQSGYPSNPFQDKPIQPNPITLISCKGFSVSQRAVQCSRGAVEPNEPMESVKRILGWKTKCRRRVGQNQNIPRDPITERQMMIGVYDHLLREVFIVPWNHSQKVIGSLGHSQTVEANIK